MPIQSNRYYNNPQFAQAAANLSSLFAPPSGADAANWANAAATRAEAARLAQFFELSQDPNADWSVLDRTFVGVGGAPNQTLEAVDRNNATQRYGYDRTFDASTQNNIRDNQRALTEREIIEAAELERLGITDATTRRGQDITAGTAITTNRLDNQRSAITDLYGPLNPGQVRPAVPDDLMDAIGLPGVGPVAGTPKPLSEDEVTAQIIQTLDPAAQQAIAFGSTPVTNVVTPEGPRIATTLDAIGQEPVINRGSEARPDLLNYRTPDGAAGTAVYDIDTGALVDTQTGERLPAGSQTFKAQSGGSVDDALGTTANNQAERQLLDITVAKNTALRLRDLISQSPASQGAVGWLRGTAQNIIATGGELGEFFGGGVAEAERALESGLIDQNLAGAFDPNIPAIELMANLLAFQYAKTTTGERLSNEMLRTTKEALGLTGLTANRESSLARLDSAISLIEDQEEIYRRARAGGVNSLATGRTAPAGPTPEAGGPRLRFNPETGQIE